jgi:ribosomal protein L13E
MDMADIVFGRAKGNLEKSMSTILSFPIDVFRDEARVKTLTFERDKRWRDFLDLVGKATALSFDVNEAHKVYLAADTALKTATEKLEPADGIH